MLIPEKVNYIIKKLTESGYEAFAVGGCVRDTLLNVLPKDWDITTSAEPFEIKKIFRKTIDTGIKHGTVTVMLQGEGFEITTYRIDGEYQNNRKPKNVEFTSSLIEDLKRRDFTINAMAYNATIGLVDEFNGIKDLEDRVIRCVGNPNDRFEEDALRMLRALRFSAQLGFDIEENTKAAIKNNAELLRNISAERVQVELTKLITSNNPGTIMLAYELGITNIVLPEFDKCVITPQLNKHHIYNVGQHSIVAMENIPNNHILRWTMLLHDIAKPVTKTTDSNGVEHFYGHPVKGENLALKILKRLKFDSNTIDRVTRLIRHHDDKININNKSIRKSVSKVGVDIFEDLLLVQKADALAKNPLMNKKRLFEISEIEKKYHEIVSENQCLTIKQLAINGKDLLDLGIPQGKRVGEILSSLLDQVLDNPEQNDREILINIVKAINRQS
ncbi:MAG: hypothetical protein K0R15_1936 [Clostridiales bacterium]|jgi:tRNA nucleotidyltransferase (CCA-adding enzyme)|nr:hypothetical protein [Clostridiales bacterium]